LGKQQAQRIDVLGMIFERRRTIPVSLNFFERREGSLKIEERKIAARGGHLYDNLLVIHRSV
jgi:hypothetical protein